MSSSIMETKWCESMRHNLYLSQKRKNNMQDTPFRDLLLIREQKAEFKAKLKEIEDKAAPIHDSIAKCEELEHKLGEKIMEGMNKEGIKTVEFKGRQIIK